MKKSYMVPETATEQFLELMGMLMDSSENGMGDANVDEGNDNIHAPHRKVF